MFTMLTVIRKKPEITTEEFRHFMKYVYGPTYVEMAETRSYIQYYLSDMMNDGAEPSIDAIVQISFESEDEMRTILRTDSYKKAHEMRQQYMRETSIGIHSAVVDEIVKMV